MNRNLRVLLVAHGFPPRHHSGTARPAAFVRYFPDFGIDTFVLCGADEDERVEAYPAAHPADDGTPVLACDWDLSGRGNGAVLPDESLWRRLPIGWTLSARRRRDGIIGRIVDRALPALRDWRPDVVLSTSPPFESAILGDRLAGELGIAHVCDLRDPWTIGTSAVYRHWFDYRLELAQERQVLRSAVAVIANTPKAGEVLTSEVGIDPAGVEVIANGYDEAQFQRVARAQPVARGEDDKFRILYTGALRSPDRSAPKLRQRLKSALGFDYRPLICDESTRSPRWFLRGLADFLEKNPAARKSVEARFVGHFRPEVHREFEAFAFPDCLSVSDPVSHDEAIRQMLAADLLLLLQVAMTRRGGDCSLAIPGKVYEYLRSGRPILAPVQPGDTADLVRRGAAGAVVAPTDSSAISRAIESAWTYRERDRFALVDAPGSLQAFERRQLTRRLATLIRSVVPSSEAAPAGAVSDSSAARPAAEAEVVGASAAC